MNQASRMLLAIATISIWALLVDFTFIAWLVQRVAGLDACLLGAATTIIAAWIVGWVVKRNKEEAAEADNADSA